MFKKATKAQQKLRMLISGPTGAGKTYTALAIGKHLGTKMAVIDTEHGSASKYAGDVAEFDACELDFFAVQKYLEAIRNAAREGYDVLVVDSLSHAWAGKGGILEEADKRGGKFSAWATLTPIQQSLVETILSYPGHIICTVRSKMAYEVSTEDRGGRKETKVEKVGLAPIQRDDLSYEFDVVIDMDERNNGRVTKTRCASIAGAVISKPGEDLANTLKAWLSDGAPAPAPAPAKVNSKADAACAAIKAAQALDRLQALEERVKAVWESFTDDEQERVTLAITEAYERFEPQAAAAGGE